MPDILNNQDIAFHFNPFAGVDHKAISRILVPKFDVDTLAEEIEKADSLIVEFVGKKGRGKTTHLVYLYQRLQQYPIFLLNQRADYREIVDHPSPIVLIDSIHHLSLAQRFAIFKNKRVVILTRHWPKKWEYLLCNKPMRRIRFKGLQKDVLKRIIHKRLTLAQKDPDVDISLNEEAINALLRKHKDDYRSIINSLFETFQQL